MKRLLLLRHAKAVPASSKWRDRDRPLNDRGMADAPRMATAMQHNGYIPDHVLCSAAKRTVQTWEQMAAELVSPPSVTFLDELYLASSKAILQTIRQAPDSSLVLLVVGHNPGLEECAQALVHKPQGDRERRLLETLKEKFPTTALAVVDFEIDAWSAAAAATGALTDFLRPRDLKDE